MKKIKKISYPTKYKELIDKYGEDDGSELYYKFIRGTSLEKYILKYGEDEGIKKYEELKQKNKKSGVSLQKMINKYGEDEGRKKYENWKLNTRQDLDGFIRRYGEDEGKKKYDIFLKKCLDALEKKTKNVSPRTMEYWLEKCNNDQELAQKKLSEYQNNSSLDKFIERYGEEDGKKKYIENCSKCAITLEKMIELHGEIKGKEKYDEWKKSNKNSKEKYIKKYGFDKYKDLIKNRLKSNNRYSNIGLEFCQEIVNNLEQKYDKIYYGDNEYMFFIYDEDFNIISPDLYIKDINLVIEFYGDFWHKNPKKYDINQDFVKETWTHDNKRLDKIKEKFNTHVIIIWEDDYKQNKEKTIKEVIQKINKIYEKNKY